MFGNSTEKRVLREADKIVSLKEDIDSLSWGRVLEIGKALLEEGVADDVRADMARELVSIAQSNLSMYVRLGIEPVPHQVMASGIEVMEGGLAEAALEEHNSTAPAPVRDVPAPSDALRAMLEGVIADQAEDPGEEDFEAAMVHEELKLVVNNDPDEHDFTLVSEDPDEDAEPEHTLTIADILDSLPSIPKYGEPVEEKPQSPEVEPDDVSEPQEGEAPVDPTPTVVEESPAVQDETASEEPPSECAPDHETDESAEERQIRFARFRNLYESRDGGLCVFEDEYGHLVAVDSSKLA